MTGYHDIPYELQDAVKSYLTGSLPSPAKDLPIVSGAQFEGRDEDHIYVAVPRLLTPWNQVRAEMIVGVGTLRDTEMDQHREYCRQVFDLIMNYDFASEFNASSARIKINQGDQPTGGLTSGIADNLRFLELSREYLIYSA